MDELKFKSYLGDGVYAGYDGYQIWLWADRDGRRHSIALEHAVTVSLIGYVKTVTELIKAGKTEVENL